MRLYRLTNAETKKSLSRPSLYIMGIFLAILLVFTAIIYNPASIKNTNPSFSALSLAGDTVNEVLINFNSEKDTYTVSKTKISDILNYYNNNSLTIKTIYNPLDETSSEIFRLSNNFLAYFNLSPTDPILIYNQKKNELVKTITKLKSEFTKLLNASQPVIIITTKTKTAIEQNLVTLESFLNANQESVESHRNAANNIYSSQIIYSLQKQFSTVLDVNLSGDFLAALSVKNLEIETKLINLLSSVNGSKAPEEMRENAAKYASLKITGEKIISNSLYLEIINNYSDYEINNLFKLNIHPFVNDGQQVFYRSYVVEELSKNNYLFKNNVYSYQYNENFNKFETMGQTANAFDYSFYAMEFISFFIIMCACIIAASSISGEYSSGTIKMLAIRPYSRGKIISSKFLSTLLLTFLLVILTAIITLITGIINFGININPILAVFNSDIVFAINPILMYIIYLACILIKAIVFISVAMMFSVLFKNNTPAIIFALIAFFIAPIITSFVPLIPLLTYIPLINIDLFKFFGNQLTSSHASQNSFLQLFTSQNFLSSNIFTTFIIAGTSIALCLTVAYSLFKTRDIQ